MYSAKKQAHKANFDDWFYVPVSLQTDGKYGFLEKYYRTFFQ
jgi:hypothetical protein